MDLDSGTLIVSDDSYNLHFPLYIESKLIDPGKEQMIALKIGIYLWQPCNC